MFYGDGHSLCPCCAHAGLGLWWYLCPFPPVLECRTCCLGDVQSALWSSGCELTFLSLLAYWPLHVASGARLDGVIIELSRAPLPPQPALAGGPCAGRFRSQIVGAGTDCVMINELCLHVKGMFQVRANAWGSKWGGAVSLVGERRLGFRVKTTI